MTLKELETNEKLKYWYHHIQQQHNSGMTVTGYCKENGLTVSVYYDYQKKIKQLLCDEINTNSSNNAVVPFVAVPNNAKAPSNDKTSFTRGGITITCESSVTYEEVEAILRALLC